MNQFKPVGDALSVGTIVAAMGGWLPAIAALISIIWGLIRIYETKTVQGLLSRRKGKSVPCEQCGKSHE